MKKCEMVFQLPVNKSYIVKTKLFQRNKASSLNTKCYIVSYDEKYLLDVALLLILDGSI